MFRGHKKSFSTHEPHPWDWRRTIVYREELEKLREENKRLKEIIRLTTETIKELREELNSHTKMKDKF